MRRGSVLVAVVVALVVLLLVVVAVVTTVSRSSELSVLQIQGSRAQYAAEAAANMAVKEVLDGVDQDGDGGVGTISNDSNASTDPTINNGTRMWVTRSDSAGVITLTAHAENADAVRAIRVTLASASGPDPLLFLADRLEASAPPRVTGWNGSAWSAPAVVGFATISNQVDFSARPSGDGAAIVLDSSGQLRRYSLVDGMWKPPVPISSTVGGPNSPGAKVVDESLSGDTLIVYRDTTNGSAILHQQLVNETVSGSGSISLGFSDPIDSVVVAASPATDQILAVARGDRSVRSARWTGSAWAAETLATHATTNEGVGWTFDAAIETASDDRLIAIGQTDFAGTHSIRLRGATAAATTFSTLQTVTLSDRPTLVRLMRNPRSTSNEIMLVYADGSGQATAVPWDGAALDYSKSVTLMAAGVGPNGMEPRLDIAYQADGAKAVVAFVRAGESQIRLRVWDGSVWSTEQLGPDLGSVPMRIRLSKGKAPTEIIAACMLAAASRSLTGHLVYSTGGAVTVSGGSVIHGPFGSGTFSLPSAGPSSTGTTDVTVNNNASVNLAPGDWRDLRMGDNSLLNLTGSGLYRFRSMTVTGKTNVRLVAKSAAASTNVFVATGDVSPGAGFTLRASGGQVLQFRLQSGNLNLAGTTDIRGVYGLVYGSVAITGAASIYGNLFATGPIAITGGAQIYGHTSVYEPGGGLVAFPITGGTAGNAATILSSPHGSPMWSSFLPFGLGAGKLRITSWQQVDPASP